MLTIVLDQYKWDWELGFSQALEFNVCDPTMADISEEAYRTGYAYAMDWIIEHHNGQKLHSRIPLRGAAKFKSQSITSINL